MRLRLPVAAVFVAAIFSAGGAAGAAGEEGGFLGFFRKQTAQAQFRIGSMYYLGKVVQRDSRAAADWWRRAAESGHAEAQHNLGVMHYRGEGVPRDYAAAAKWYQLSAEQGFASAQHNLGMLHREGEGIPHNPHQAYVWLSLAAEQGFEKSIKFRREVAATMSPKDLSAAQAEAVRLRRAIQARIDARTK